MQGGRLKTGSLAVSSKFIGVKLAYKTGSTGNDLRISEM